MSFTVYIKLTAGEPKHEAKSCRVLVEGGRGEEDTENSVKACDMWCETVDLTKTVKSL